MTKHAGDPGRPVSRAANASGSKLLVWRLLPHDRRQWAMAIVAAVLFVVAAVYMVNAGKQPTETEEKAVRAASAAARGFDEVSAEYALAQLNYGVEIARDGKCAEAHAVYDDVAGRKNNLKPIDQQVYKKKIDSICSKQK